MLIETPEIQRKRRSFFRYVFGDQLDGYVCLVEHNPTSNKWNEEYFRWPSEEERIQKWIISSAPGHDVYYCPMILSKAKRNKESVEGCTCAWADLDSCHPDNLIVPPTIVTESSPGHYQAVWVFLEPVDVLDGEDISRRIAYKHASQGVDKSGWDLSQLLRVPYTQNFKYTDGIEHPIVSFLATNDAPLTKESFSMYPPAKGYEEVEYPFPQPEELEGLDAAILLERYRNRLMPTTWHLFEKEPEGTWSEDFWNLQMLLFEGGLSRAEVLIICREAACNKYRRDNRREAFLWREICRSFSSFEARHSVATSATIDSPLLSDEERRWCSENPTIVEDYVAWAKTVGDAAWQYHEAGGFVILSSLLAGNVKLPTSYGLIAPNLWFMILADTTLTRKTTAMDLAMDIITEVDSDAVLATDGTIEGLFTALATRPGRPSIFLRDEFSGLLESIAKKDYYAGMAETLTKLYDGKYLKRLLRKETIEVRDPCLILFAGGIKERTLSLITYEQVASGFMPRFVFITAESDITKLKPLGPPTEVSLLGRDNLLDRFRAISSHYKQFQTVKVGNLEIESPKVWRVTMTPDAWLRYNKLEAEMQQMGLEAFHRDLLTPSFVRLAGSGLKAAILIAAARKLDEQVIIEEQDIIRAFSYVETWRTYTLDILNNIGRTTQERTIEQIRRAIYGKATGALRSELMQNYHINAREMDMIIQTLDQRGHITSVRSGRTWLYYPINASGGGGKKFKPNSTAHVPVGQ